MGGDYRSEIRYTRIPFDQERSEDQSSRNLGESCMTSKRCVALYSGGLDSILVVKMMQEQSIDVIPVFFCSPFFGMDALQDPEPFKESHRKNYGIDVYPIDFSSEIIKIVSNPKHGYGKNLNPCIDCKIGMLKKAGELLKTLDASFVVTGEVLGQRPMSQRRDTMNLIIKETGLKDILLRPLCAKHLLPTLPEREGLIRRELLGDIAGRGRKIQMDLAMKYGIDLDALPTPAGGCLLTYEQIAGKVRSTFKRFQPCLPSPADIMLDTLGRKFILDDETVLVVSRDEEENKRLSSLAFPGNVFMKIADVPGPLCIIRGNDSEENCEKAASICLRYGKAKGESGYTAVYGPDPLSMTGTINAQVMSDDRCKTFQIDLNV
jgi:tRNA-uridine 2-sulfurtransferase